jgi:hypothetical protein
MFVRLYLGNQKISVPFSSRKVAVSFVRGFNEYARAIVQKTEYPCRDDAEQRGARFCENIVRFCTFHRITFAWPNNRLEIHADKEDSQSLFDGFE